MSMRLVSASVLAAFFFLGSLPLEVFALTEEPTVELLAQESGDSLPSSGANLSDTAAGGGGGIGDSQKNPVAGGNDTSGYGDTIAPNVADEQNPGGGTAGGNGNAGGGTAGGNGNAGENGNPGGGTAGGGNAGGGNAGGENGIGKPGGGGIAGSGATLGTAVVSPIAVSSCPFAYNRNNEREPAKLLFKEVYKSNCGYTEPTQQANQPRSVALGAINSVAKHYGTNYNKIARLFMPDSEAPEGNQEVATLQANGTTQVTTGQMQTNTVETITVSPSGTSNFATAEAYTLPLESNTDESTASTDNAIQ